MKCPATLNDCTNRICQYNILSLEVLKLMWRSARGTLHAYKYTYIYIHTFNKAWPSASYPFNNSRRRTFCLYKGGSLTLIWSVLLWRCSIHPPPLTRLASKAARVVNSSPSLAVFHPSLRHSDASLAINVSRINNKCVSPLAVALLTLLREIFFFRVHVHCILRNSLMLELIAAFTHSFRHW